MLTPKRRGWPGWSPKTPPPPPLVEDMAGSSHVATPTATAGGSSGGRALVEAPQRNLMDNNGEIVATRGEPKIWRRFKEVRSLDQESLEKKDRAALVVHVTKLEAEGLPLPTLEHQRIFHLSQSILVSNQIPEEVLEDLKSVKSRANLLRAPLTLRSNQILKRCWRTSSQ